MERSSTASSSFPAPSASVADKDDDMVVADAWGLGKFKGTVEKDKPTFIYHKKLPLDTMSVSASPGDSELESFLSKSFLHLEKIDDNLYRSKDVMSWNQDVRGTYGGQIIGQAMVAASQSVPEDQHLHSFHSYFLKPGSPYSPILYHVENTRDGRTYTSRNIKATQEGKPIFSMEASFKILEDTSFSYHLPMYNAPSFTEISELNEALSDMKEKGQISDDQFRGVKEGLAILPIDMKFINTDDFLFRRSQEPRRGIWFRAKGHISEDENHNIHKSCLGYMTDIFLLHTSLFFHAPLADKNFFQVSLDHCMWFHSPCRADEWMLFEVTTESIGDGRTFCHGLIWDQRGKLLVTVTQEGVHRITSKM